MLFENNYLGDVAPLPASVTNYQIAPTATPPPAQVSFLTKLNTLFTKVSDTANKLAPVANSVTNTINQLKTTQANAPQYADYSSTPPPNPATPTGLSTGAKIGLGVAGATLVGVVIYYATKPTKKK